MAVVFYILCILAALHLEAATRIQIKGSLQGDKKRLWRRGSDDALSVTGRPEQGYSIEIFLGTPPQTFSVVVDTGSSNFAVAASPTAGVATFFNSASSTTYSGRPDDKIEVKYFNGSWQGFFAQDVLKLCESCVSVQVDVALITTSTSFFVAPLLWQGILGLGYSALVQPSPNDASTVLDSLKSEGSMSDIFSMTLCGRENQDTTLLTGSLEFDLSGAEDGYEYTDIVKEWYYQIELTNITVNGEAISVHCYELNTPAAFIDSGTTNMIFSTSVYYHILAAVESYANTAAQENGTVPVPQQFLLRKQSLCVEGSSTVFSSFPEIVISVAGNSTHTFDINVPPQQYIRQTMESIKEQQEISNTSTTYCYKFGIEEGGSGTILGAAFLEQMTVIHDRAHKRVGFKVDTSLCNVSDPVFTKTISSLKARQDQGSCLVAPKSIIPTIALVLTVVIILTTLSVLIGWLYKNQIIRCGVQLTLTFRRHHNYSYMLNSDDEASSLQLELDEVPVSTGLIQSRDQ